MRVAIVGNGPSAVGLGEQIDACDFVIRLRSYWNRTAGVRRDKMFRWEMDRPAYGEARTGQAMLETVWETTGLYIVRTPYALLYRQRINYEDCLAYTLSPLEGIDINTEDDWELAKIVWKGLH